MARPSHRDRRRPAATEAEDLGEEAPVGADGEPGAGTGRPRSGVGRPGTGNGRPVDDAGRRGTGTGRPVDGAGEPGTLGAAGDTDAGDTGERELWCDACEVMVPIGDLDEDDCCPTCGEPLGARRVPWKFRLMIAATAVYLVYRAVQGVEWVIHHA